MTVERAPAPEGTVCGVDLGSRTRSQARTTKSTVSAAPSFVSGYSAGSAKASGQQGGAERVSPTVHLLGVARSRFPSCWRNRGRCGRTRTVSVHSLWMHFVPQATVRHGSRSRPRLAICAPTCLRPAAISAWSPAIGSCCRAGILRSRSCRWNFPTRGSMLGSLC
jgi:hypothetical protein